MYRLIVLSLLQSLLLCGGQVALKLAVLHMDKQQPFLTFVWRSVLLNWRLACCGLLMTGAGLLWMYILRHFPLSSAYPLTALSFVFGMLAAIWIFREPVSWTQWAGVAFILIGCWLITK